MCEPLVETFKHPHKAEVLFRGEFGGGGDGQQGVHRTGGGCGSGCTLMTFSLTGLSRDSNGERGRRGDTGG